MPVLDADPLAEGGIADFARAFRAGTITSEQATRAYLARIAALDGRLGAFQYVAAESALATACAIDTLRRAGTDLGPLMGLPVSVKDLFAVDGMPITAGSHMAVDDIAGPEGPLVRSLRRAGCVILGKTRTVEFALGITGVSTPRGTPVNPWDATTRRLPGGSSSGAGVAVAAGLCGLAIGSDTGGSVRAPAAFCGVFGLKTTPGVFATEGAVPLAPHLDTPGLLTRTAADAAIAFAALTGTPAPQPRPAARLRLGVPDDYVFDDLDPAVAGAVTAALEAATAAGIGLVPVSLPGLREREEYFPAVLPACLIATLGRERFLAGRDRMDPIVARRAAHGLEVTAAAVMALEARRTRTRRQAATALAGLDGWVSPTTTVPAPPVAALDDPDRALALALGMTRNTQPANYFGVPAVTLPLPRPAGALPVGVQVVGYEHGDADVLAIALALEAILGTGGSPDLSGFVG